MKISPDEVRHVADLARLELDPGGVETLARQIATILGYVDKLNEVDTQGVAATSHASALTNAFRKDAPRSHLPREDALSNAPRKAEGSFVVPRVI